MSVSKVLSLTVGLVVMATLFAASCTGHVRGMKDVRWLSDAEKEKVIEIALSTTEAKGRLVEYGPEYKADLSWVSIVWSKNGQFSQWRRFEYDIVAVGLPRGDTYINIPGSDEMIYSAGVPESAEIYSWVQIDFENPSQWQVYVAVNPDTGRVAYVQENLFNTGPQKPIN